MSLEPATVAESEQAIAAAAEQYERGEAILRLVELVEAIGELGALALWADFKQYGDLEGLWLKNILDSRR